MMFLYTHGDYQLSMLQLQHGLLSTS
ncbi:hypothetical protein F383_16622 [Gossypium arboreum]|uniref:Uncharacterized protein n=1 Tax=Gossypium arboreum TaxID=29729 RepID=A0A0B0NC72_GOSAR|nr:hypothetical protein F383_16622 [Gossypium arboreum]